MQMKKVQRGPKVHTYIHTYIPVALKSSPFGSWGRVGDLTIDPGPVASKLTISKVSRKRHEFQQGNFHVHVAVLIIIIITIVISHSDMFVQHSVLLMSKI